MLVELRAKAVCDTAAFSRIRDAGIGIFAYDAVSFGRSSTSPRTRSLVVHKDHMPDDVVAFVEVKPTSLTATPPAYA